METSSSARVLAWLLRGDPAVRWQVLRDLQDAPARAWRRERRRVATEGWGRRLLDRQRPDGNWGRGPYQPKWTCTTYTMQLLRQLGLPPGHPAALRACAIYLDALAADGSVNLWAPGRRTGDACVTAMILGQLCAFGVRDRRIERIVENVLREQMPDGGWNCRRSRGADHASFHTTTCALEGLHEYAAAGRPRAAEALAAAARGREFLAVHGLFRSHRTGRTVAAEMTRFHFRRTGATTCSAPSTSSGPRARRGIRASRMPSRSSRGGAAGTAAGRSRARTLGWCTSSSSDRARRAG